MMPGYSALSDAAVQRPAPDVRRTPRPVLGGEDALVGDALAPRRVDAGRRSERLSGRDAGRALVRPKGFDHVGRAAG